MLNLMNYVHDFVDVLIDLKFLIVEVVVVKMLMQMIQLMVNNVNDQ